MSKWLHIQGGDEGLRQFFQWCFDQLESGGYLLLEPQPWESYRKVIKESPASLRIRPGLAADLVDSEESQETFWTILENQIGFRHGQVIYEPGADAKSFDKRPLWTFQKP